MNKYVIAKYIRLSLDDVITESTSIPAQRMLLDRHIDDMDIPNIEILEFVDNGHSGTNMERPAVQELIDLVRSGGVNCICVKDFSRFSRSAMDSGYFIEQVFPLYQVRFVSVNDSFDSDNYKNDTGGIDVAFKFLMHDYYSADLSKKVKSAKRVQMLRGENIVKNAVYGYQKNDGGKWEPDPVSSEIVKQIFDMALDGLPSAVIRDRLCDAACPTPREYVEMKRGKDIAPACRWEPRAINGILSNVQYIGSYVAGKQESKRIGSHSKIWIDSSDWIVIPDSHPPIISKDVFAEVQYLLETRLKSAYTEKPIRNVLAEDENRPKRARMVSGERLANNAIYGYSKKADGTLEVDEAAAEVIRRIFDWTAQGLSIEEIRENLHSVKTPTPSEHISLKRGKDITPGCCWTVKCVRNMLKNIQYTGAYVSGKILKDYETGKSYHTAESDWIIIPDKNPPVVSQEAWNNVQAILAERRENRRVLRPRAFLLRGKVKCGCCNHSLSYDPISNPVFRCAHTLPDAQAECHRMIVNVGELDDAVMTIIRKQAEVVLNSSDLTMLRRHGDNGRQVAERENQIRELVDQRQTNYERFVSQQIDRAEYLSLKTDCTAQIERLSNQLAIMRQQQRDKLAAQKNAAIAKKALSEAATLREIVETLVERIDVFPGDRIEVEWKIADFAIVRTV